MRASQGLRSGLPPAACRRVKTSALTLPSGHGLVPPAPRRSAALATRLPVAEARALRRPDRVLRVLADLAPMGAIGPVALDEAAVVLADRLRSIETDPPARRYGRLLITTWTDSSLLVLDAGKITKVVGGLPGPADIGLDRERGRIAVPLLTENRLEFVDLPQ